MAYEDGGVEVIAVLTGEGCLKSLFTTRCHDFLALCK